MPEEAEKEAQVEEAAPEEPEEEDEDEFFNGQSTNPAEAAYKQSESSWNSEKPTWGDDAE